MVGIDGDLGGVDPFSAESVEVAGRLGWTSELVSASKLMSAPSSSSARGQSPSSSGGCYVATAVYGSYDCPEVWILRGFRDDTLNSTMLGRVFVRVYYLLSPVAVVIGGSLLRDVALRPLDRLVGKLRARGVSDSRYSGE